jgi:hypothetical protein
MTGMMEISIGDLVTIGVELGLIAEGEKQGAEKMRTLVEDDNWTYTETQRRLHKLLPSEATIILTPQGHFAYGDLGPLLEVLRKGEADPELQAWLADMIEQGAFAERKTLSERMDAMGSLGEAIEDFDYVEELLRERGRRRGSHKDAMRIVALRHRVHIEKLERYFKRGGKDRHKVIKRVRSPFKP